MTASVDGARAEGLACADPGARTPIGASGNFDISNIFGAVQNSCEAVLPISESFIPSLLYIKRYNYTH